MRARNGRAPARNSRLALAVCGALAGCTAPQCAGGNTAPAHFAGPVDIGHGRTIYLTCRGAGMPAVILVAGLKASADDWTGGDGSMPVWSGLSRLTRVCAYDRPGTPVGEQPSRSSPVAQPTTAADAVADLDALLRATHIARPVVLVGHSYGGLIARLAAQTHPGMVAGLVLVDALSEGLKDAETPAEWAMQRLLMAGEITESVALYPALERIDPDRSFDQVRAAPSLRLMPLVVLSADRPVGPLVRALIQDGTLPPSVPPDFGNITDAAQRRAQARLATLAPGARHVTRTDSGHDIHHERPDLVVAAAADIIAAVRAGRTAMDPAAK